MRWWLFWGPCWSAHMPWMAAPRTARSVQPPEERSSRRQATLHCIGVLCMHVGQAWTAIESILDCTAATAHRGCAAQVAAFYSWPAVAACTERVYAATMREARDDTPLGRLRRYIRCGPIFGPLACMVAAFDMIFLHWLEWWQPTSRIATCA